MDLSAILRSYIERMLREVSGMKVMLPCPCQTLADTLLQELKSWRRIAVSVSSMTTCSVVLLPLAPVQFPVPRRWGR